MASSSQNSDLEPRKTNKDEQKKQFEDIENPSAEEILKRIKECYGEAVGKAFEGKNLAVHFWRETAQHATNLSSFFLFYSFLFGVLK